jgi:hypothetical protein
MQGSEMSTDMALLFTKLKEELDKQTEIITKNVSASILQSVEDKLNPVIEENRFLKSEIEKLSAKVNFLEATNKRNHIIIHGVEETEQNAPDLLNKVIQTIRSIEVEIVPSDIDKIYRLGKKVENTGKVRAILLATTTTLKKQEILRNKKKMCDNTYITEDYTRETLDKRKQLQEEVNKAREAGLFATIKNNRVIIKEKKKSNDKRRRSESTSPKTSSTNQTNAAKLHKPDENRQRADENIIHSTEKVDKVDAFSIMRASAYSLSEKNTYRS